MSNPNDKQKAFFINDTEATFIYRALLNEIEHDGFQVLTQRISLTPMRKLWIAWRTWVAG